VGGAQQAAYNCLVAGVEGCRMQLTMTMLHESPTSHSLYFITP